MSKNITENKKAERTNLFSLLYIPVTILFMEIASRIYLFGFAISIELLYVLLGSLILAGLFMFIISFFNKKGQFIVTLILIFIFGAYCCVHLVYTHTFHSFFSWNTLGIADDVTEFYREAWESIVQCAGQIITVMVPVIVLIIMHKHLYLTKKLNLAHVSQLGLSLLSALALIFAIRSSAENSKLIKYMDSYVNMTYKHYGITTSTAVDIYHTIFGSETEPVINPYINTDQRNMIDITAKEEKVILKNALNIDFDAMIAASPNSTIKDMHQYFSSVPASNQNEYTGLFEGKNLVFLTLEGFSYKAISPEITPTLYKMYTEGFYFTNFYDSLWGGSTATGEYANMTGNFYPTANCLPLSANTLQYSAMGNLFKNAGYKTLAYHDNTYTYYSRNYSHPNFGYTWKAIGNGLSMSYHWPRSDYEMAVNTIDEYINLDEPFHVYYMTISGHTNYTFGGNEMAARHRSEVASLPYGENARAYVACNIEVENMLTYLIEKFDEAGILDNTVFAMCADHYPYGLSNTGLSELYGLENTSDIRANIELYRNSFILWSSSMEEPVVVDTPCSSIDIIPTLANLFGLEFDSRFITGTDILSDSENIAIINTLTTAGGNYNWITTEGTYHSPTKQFVPSESCTMSEEEITAYVTKTNLKVDAMRTYSLAILNNDYYKYVFNKDGTAKYLLEDE